MVTRVGNYQTPLILWWTAKSTSFTSFFVLLIWYSDWLNWSCIDHWQLNIGLLYYRSLFIPPRSSLYLAKYWAHRAHREHAGDGTVVGVKHSPMVGICGSKVKFMFFFCLLSSPFTPHPCRLNVYPSIRELSTLERIAKLYLSLLRLSVSSSLQSNTNQTSAVSKFQEASPLIYGDSEFICATLCTRIWLTHEHVTAGMSLGIL